MGRRDGSKQVQEVALLAAATGDDTRTLFDPRELPVGVITALVGAPVFALLLLRSRKLA